PSLCPGKSWPALSGRATSCCMKGEHPPLPTGWPPGCFLFPCRESPRARAWRGRIPGGEGSSSRGLEMLSTWLALVFRPKARLAPSQQRRPLALPGTTAPRRPRGGPRLRLAVSEVPGRVTVYLGGDARLEEADVLEAALLPLVARRIPLV